MFYQKQDDTISGLSYLVHHFPEIQIFDSSKLNEFADDNFKFDENDKSSQNW